MSSLHYLLSSASGPPLNRTCPRFLRSYYGLSFEQNTGQPPMKFLAVHPSALMYTKVFLRLEPLGLELVAEVVRRAGHQVRLIDLQVETARDYFKLIERWRPQVVAFSCNYLANVPEIIDLCKLTKARLPPSFVLVGGHSA